MPWYTFNQRPMPWRVTRDPYFVWLSEVMLQQTQVATVIPYYLRFVAAFPTVHALASAPLEDVLRLWAGLGYYSRARNLHRGARTIVECFGGTLPASPEKIREIEGIGAYTAGAILSIAFGKPEPLVDGNVVRLFSRLRLLPGAADANKAEFWALARELVEQAHADGIGPGDFNQALMEFGSTVCLPRSPRCDVCPVATLCMAKERGVQAEYPAPKTRKESPIWHLRAWLFRDDAGRVLLSRRAAGGLFGGLWELPTERVAACAKEVVAAFARVEHVLSHRVLKISAFAAQKAQWRPEHFANWSGTYEEHRWLPLSDALAGRVALSAAQVKILSKAAGIDSGGETNNHGKHFRNRSVDAVRQRAR